ncbi:hypothetical protein JCM10207_007212 [Rhodosporidiobolus poonsookiae]
MSTNAHKFWPSEGSKWQHWSDLLLATQLAAARAGFTGMARYWDVRLPNVLKLRCNVEPNARRQGRCRQALLAAEPVDLNKPDGAWKVTSVVGACLEASRHPEHKGGLGLSSWLKERPTEPLDLSPGDEITGYRAMHTLEGSLRSAARQDGRFLLAAVESTLAPTYTVTCVLGAQRCAYLIRFRELVVAAGEESRWKCLEIRSRHSCSSDALPPQERMTWRMNFFPAIMLHDGCTGKRAEGRTIEADAKLQPIDQRMGFYPVRRGAESSISSALAELSSATDAVRRLKAELAAAEKLAQVKRERVEKKRRKLLRVVEKEKAKRERKASGSSRLGGGQKEKKKRDMAEKSKKGV